MKRTRTIRNIIKIIIIEIKNEIKTYLSNLI